MASGNKTVATDADVDAFIASVEHDGRRADAERLLELFGKVTRQPPVLWGSSIIGYGSYHYVYESGREGDHLRTGFSPRKSNLVLYIMTGFEAHADLREQLGKHKVGKSCLYINRLDDVHLLTLEKMVRADWKEMAKRYGKP